MYNENLNVEGADARNIISVSELNEYIKGKLESDSFLYDVYLRGEISNFTNHYKTGHFYFRIKDETSVVDAVMFRGNNAKLKFVPENGMKIIAHGRIGAFVRDGKYQIYCDDMEPDGIGSLYIAYEQLKRKLEAEGLFSPERKKPIPKIPSRIGVITSPTGAAVRDIINVLGRRFPYAEMVLYGALVQGADAAPSLIDGIRHFNRAKNVDVIIIGRGGGSIEDLWAFNNEGLAREIAACTIPVISAVGHETDYTICDFVADKRAPTPSAAAELAVPDTHDLMRRISNVTDRCAHLLSSMTAERRKYLEQIASRPVLKNPERYIDDRRMDLGHLDARLTSAIDAVKEKKTASFSLLAAKLDALSPLAVLTRGYSFVSDGEGKVQKKASGLTLGQDVSISFSDGDARCRVEEIKLKN